MESVVSAGRADVAIAEAILDKTRIRAPAGGKVLQQHAKLGEIVGPSPETPLIVVGDVGTMRVKADVDEADVAKVKVGQKAFVRSNSYPGREFEGTVAPSVQQGVAKTGPLYIPIQMLLDELIVEVREVIRIVSAAV